jgi:hypothetical protein
MPGCEGPKKPKARGEKNIKKTKHARVGEVEIEVTIVQPSDPLGPVNKPKAAFTTILRFPVLEVFFAPEGIDLIVRVDG